MFDLAKVLADSSFETAERAAKDSTGRAYALRVKAFEVALHAAIERAYLPTYFKKSLRDDVSPRQFEEWLVESLAPAILAMINPVDAVRYGHSLEQGLPYWGGEALTVAARRLREVEAKPTKTKRLKRR